MQSLRVGDHAKRVEALAPSVAEVEGLQDQVRHDLRLQAATLEARDRELKSASRLLQQRERELGHARASESRLRARATRAQGRAEALAAELDDGKAALERLRGELALAQEELSAQRAKVEDAHADMSFLRSRLASREAELSGHAQERVAVEAARLEAENATRELRSEATAAERRAGEARDLLNARSLELSALRDETAKKQAALEEARAAMQRERSKTRAREQVLTDTTLTLRQVSDYLDRIEESRSWRFGHSLFRWLRIMSFRKPLGQGAVRAAKVEVERALESTGHAQRMSRPRPRSRAQARPAAKEDDDDSASAGPGPPRDSKERAELALLVRARLGAPPQITDPPLVSILVVSRNGRSHLTRLLDALRNRTEYPRLELIVVDNASSDGSIELLEGSLLPFALKLVRNVHNASFSEASNQAAELAEGDLSLLLNNDVEPVEAGWLTELVACHERSRAGAVGALLVHADARRGTPSGWEVQHRGIRFRQRAGMLKGFNEGAGEDLLGGVLGPDRECPAVTAACLLVPTELYRSIGGLHPGYRYGSEDIDFCLTLQERGERVVCCGRAVLTHAESSTQAVAGHEVTRSNRLSNRQVFHERWGPRLWRQANLDRLSRDGFWAPDRAVHIAIARTSDDPADGYGDWYTAEEMGNALAHEGFVVEYVDQRRWHSDEVDADYVLVLLDRYDPARAPVTATTIAWIRNWTDRWIGRQNFRDYAVLLASSATSADLVERETGRRPHVLPLATNPERFQPASPAVEAESDYVFAGNRWGVERPIELALRIKRDERVRIVGKGWSSSEPLAHLAEAPLPYDELPALYSSSKVVLDDASSHTLPYDSVNSRVFDALAAGAVVVTNCVGGVRQVFDDDFPTYDDAASLRAQLDRLLGDEALRRRIADRYRAEVLGAHTYSHRARALTAILSERLGRLRFCIKAGPSAGDVAHQGGDLHFARAIHRELRAQGHDAVVQARAEWDALEGLEYDVALHLKGADRYRPKPGQLNVLWNVSHPDPLTSDECAASDVVLVPSQRLAEELRGQTSTPVHVLEHATDAGLVEALLSLTAARWEELGFAPTIRSGAPAPA